MPTTLFEKMRANRRHWQESREARKNRLLQQIDDIERQELALWRGSDMLDPDGSVVPQPPRRRLFWWVPRAAAAG